MNKTSQASILVSAHKGTHCITRLNDSYVLVGTPLGLINLVSSNLDKPEILTFWDSGDEEDCIKHMSVDESSSKALFVQSSGTRMFNIKDNKVVSSVVMPQIRAAQTCGCLTPEGVLVGYEDGTVSLHDSESPDTHSIIYNAKGDSVKALFYSPGHCIVVHRNIVKKVKIKTKEVVLEMKTTAASNHTFIPSLEIMVRATEAVIEIISMKSIVHDVTQTLRIGQVTTADSTFKLYADESLIVYADASGKVTAYKRADNKYSKLPSINFNLSPGATLQGLTVTNNDILLLTSDGKMLVRSFPKYVEHKPVQITTDTQSVDIRDVFSKEELAEMNNGTSGPSRDKRQTRVSEYVDGEAVEVKEEDEEEMGDGYVDEIDGDIRRYEGTRTEREAPDSGRRKRSRTRDNYGSKLRNHLRFFDTLANNPLHIQSASAPLPYDTHNVIATRFYVLNELPIPSADAQRREYRRLLCWNQYGTVYVTKTMTNSKVDVEVINTATAEGRSFTVYDPREIHVASVCRTGVLLATAPAKEKGRDKKGRDSGRELVEEDSGIPAALIYRNLDNTIQWEQKFPGNDGETPLLIAVTDVFVACFTNHRRLRVMTVAGVQAIVKDVGHAPVTMCGWGSLLCIVYKTGEDHLSGVDDDEDDDGGIGVPSPQYGFELLDISNSSLICKGLLPVSPESCLLTTMICSSGEDDKGIPMLFTYDTSGVMRMLTSSFGHSFIPVHDAKASERARLSEKYTKVIEKVSNGESVSKALLEKAVPQFLWPISVQGGKIFGLTIRQPVPQKARLLHEDLSRSGANGKGKPDRSLVADVCRRNREMLKSFDEHYPELCYPDVSKNPSFYNILLAKSNELECDDVDLLASKASVMGQVQLVLQPHDMAPPMLPSVSSHEEGQYVVAKARSDTLATSTDMTEDVEASIIASETEADLRLLSSFKRIITSDQDGQRLLSIAKLLNLKESLTMAQHLALLARLGGVAGTISTLVEQRFTEAPDAYSIRQVPPLVGEAAQGLPFGAPSPLTGTEGALAKAVLAQVATSFRSLRAEVLDELATRAGLLAPGGSVTGMSGVFSDEIDEEPGALDSLGSLGNPTRNIRRKKTGKATSDNVSTSKGGRQDTNQRDTGIDGDGDGDEGTAPATATPTGKGRIERYRQSEDRKKNKERMDMETEKETREETRRPRKKREPVPTNPFAVRDETSDEARRQEDTLEDFDTTAAPVQVPTTPRATRTRATPSSSSTNTNTAPSISTSPSRPKPPKEMQKQTSLSSFIYGEPQTD